MQHSFALPLVRIKPIDKTVGTGNGRFLGHVANGMSREELERRFRAGEFADLHPELSREALRMRPTQ